MTDITTAYLMRAETWLLITTFIYFLMNGAQIFETAVLVPKWTVSPPESFRLLTDNNGVSLKTFWVIFHSVHEITFLLAIGFCWKLEPIRNWLLVLFTIHFAVRVWTIIYFAANIIDFQNNAETLQPGEDIRKRVTRWQTLNYLRVAIFIAVSLGLIPLYYQLLGLLH